MALELQKRCSKTPPPFALQLHGVGSSKEFWSWDVWLEFLLKLLEFWSRAMPNRALMTHRVENYTKHLIFCPFRLEGEV